MKKWPIFILLLITLIETFFPCCLADECNATEIATTQNEDKQQQEGTCSPFFACATCPGFVEFAKQIHIVEPVAEKQVHHESLQLYNLSAFQASYWQPPRSC